MTVSVAGVVLLLAWPLAAFGGRSLLTAACFSAVCVAWAVWLRPPRPLSGSRALDRWLLILAAVLLAQLLPLPAVLRELLSPNATSLESSLALNPPAWPRWRTLTIAPADSAWAVLVTFGALALFVACRDVFWRAGVRHAVRGICGLGFVLAIVALAQAATAGRLIYWQFPTEYEGPLPFGPFVNRNHYATWVVMALPLCVGYIAARLPRGLSPHPRTRHARARAAGLADGRMLWLSAGGALMLGSLLVCGSRSGIVALAAATSLVGCITRTRATPRVRGALAAVVLVMLGAAVMKADVSNLAHRFAGAQSAIQGRARIWHETLPVVRHFWLTGTGVGTYRRTMLAYQQNYREVQFNQAHNHYLQVIAEGGLVLLLPVIGAMIALARRSAEKMREEVAGAFWIRAGAACGLLAVALQSVWETGLVMPANAALAAVLAAVVLHQHRVPEVAG